MSCSDDRRPLQDLTRHLLRDNVVGKADLTNGSSSGSHTYKYQSVPQPHSGTFRQADKSNNGSLAVEYKSDLWRSANPECVPMRPAPHPTDSAFSHHSHPFDQLADSTDQASSGDTRWNPEYETYLHVARASSDTPAMSASAYVSSIPSLDEAEAIACALQPTPAHDQSATWTNEYRAASAVEAALDDLPHPLTTSANLDAAWDPKRTFTSVRPLADTQVASDADVTARPSLTQAQQVLIYTKLRETARARLDGVMKHLNDSRE
ncbi:uncharacterized protein L969DRAFT_91593 [Mixia osmundae IAM 14324]|uniref:Uncharacterized protein n=1 Tax=Mixia osmundae (strain CBS 9802 / IAM 14324 / JCM 22182 / KY 12970) TaxID=764103 RepID=G7DZX9_MIXOS|nr:uncharacterized protein L969DRAFT_91593 [Mixia osmundae IAM 14324]KEI42130.1 hypothetical protein L969DRAFT_91593 [Mixia osmundae IAM 14324]GAA96139.1 hypothetical protein E5Q_02800 [Mixia osmundae IAM 14324]